MLSRIKTTTKKLNQSLTIALTIFTVYRAINHNIRSNIKYNNSDIVYYMIYGVRDKRVRERERGGERERLCVCELPASVPRIY